ncbi:MAG TPA: DUF3800 domain-containing protein [Actinophytocola sp.]|uniref:DUF3800 domain-containing protein n=1 Tax=Actinophytocola sp. TaxID=1872138 RepID=UPI002E01F1AE|nr:DUF3800 domain-containing protein [Actinophytocola sp.]
MTSAYADESFHEAPSGGFYVLAAAMFDPAAYETARDAMRDVLGRRRAKKLHWNEMDAQQRHNAAKAVAGIDSFHVVTVGVPMPVKRQERARAKCLDRLVHELHSYGVTHLMIESRTDQLDRRDVATVTRARRHLSKDALFQVDHQAGADEPLFWAADVVAGAVYAHRRGQPGYRRVLDDCLYEIDVATDC